MSTKPIALLVTAYNRQARLERMFASLQSELHLLDIILVDDASSAPISVDAFSHYPIHLIRLPANRGAMGASNAGLEYIYTKNYEFIARLDSDDAALPGRFAKQLSFLRAHPVIGLLGGQYHAVDEAGTVLHDSHFLLNHSQIKKALPISLMLHHPTIMMRTEAAKEAGFYDKDFIASGDYDFLWRMANITQVANLPEPLIRYEVGAQDSLSTGRRRTQAVGGLKVKLRYFAPFNAYSYVGIGASALHIMGLLTYLRRVKDRLLRALV